MTTSTYVRRASPDELADSLYQQLFMGIALNADRESTARQLLRQSALEEYGIHPCVAGAHERLLQIAAERESHLRRVLDTDADLSAFRANAAVLREIYGRSTAPRIE